MRPLIFLDLDDVLVVNQPGHQAIASIKAGDGDTQPELWANLVFPEGRASLSALHKEFMPLYVISSSWTNELNREQLQKVFTRTGLEFVARHLHERWMTQKNSELERAGEIAAWISEHGQPGQPVLVLDDLASGWSLKKSPLFRKGHVVLCDAWVGLVAEKLAEAQIRLRAQYR